MSKKWTPLWREALFQVKMYKAQHVRTTFGSCDVEKVHAVVARSTCPSQNVQNTPTSDHLCKLRCSKVPAVVARSTFPSQSVQVEIWKKCTQLWREAHFKVKSEKRKKNKTRGSDHFWTFRCRFAWQVQGTVHLVKSEQNLKVL